MARKNVQARSLTLKLKTADFRIITRSLTYSAALPDETALLAAACALAGRIPPQDTAFRLIGIGVAQLQPAGQQQDLTFNNGT